VYQIPSYVRSVADSDGTTILNLETNQILALNSTGAYIWERLQRSEPVPEIVAALVDVTHANQAEVDRDVKEFLADLLHRRLVATPGVG